MGIWLLPRIPVSRRQESTMISSKENFPEPIPAWAVDTPHPWIPPESKVCPTNWSQPAARTGGSAIVFTLCSDKSLRNTLWTEQVSIPKPLHQCLGGWLPKHMNLQKQSHFDWKIPRNICLDFEGCFRHIPLLPILGFFTKLQFCTSFAQTCSRSYRLH